MDNSTSGCYRRFLPLSHQRRANVIVSVDIVTYGTNNATGKCTPWDHCQDQIPTGLLGFQAKHKKLRHWGWMISINVMHWIYALNCFRKSINKTLDICLRRTGLCRVNVI
jgi:hypothetical protein